MEGTQEARSETRIKCWKIATELWLWISFRFGTNRFFRNPHMEVELKLNYNNTKLKAIHLENHATS